MRAEFIQADATRLPFADDTFDLVFGSPPYLDARTYGIAAQRNLEQWIDWMLQVTAEAVRVSRGLVFWVCAGVTRSWCYQPGPEGLLYRWASAGGQCWRPAYWHRDGIPGSGGKQWLRANIEYVLAFTKCEKAVPFADNTINGQKPKHATGGEMSYRLTDGERTNALYPNGGNRRNPDGSRGKCGGYVKKARRCTRGRKGGDTVQETMYFPPVLANPGCLIRGIGVGGGRLGHKLAHENEAPFPEKLADWFIRGWCPLGGRVLDPFSGSGTTVASAVKLGRIGVGCDLRLSQCQLGRRRTSEVQTELYA